jgi:hypothetical protein
MSNNLIVRSSDPNRVIVGQLLNFDANSGKWSIDGKAPPAGLKLLVAGTVSVAQKWHDGKVVDTLWPDDGRNLTDAVEEGNEAVPKEQWEKGPDGKPKAPWSISHVVYLIDPATGKKLTVAAATVGQKIAVELLEGQVDVMRQLRGEDVLAEVVLGVSTFATRFGTRRPRPDYEVTSWRSLGKKTAPPLALSTVDRPTTGELLDDSIPF